MLNMMQDMQATGPERNAGSVDPAGKDVVIARSRRSRARVQQYLAGMMGFASSPGNIALAKLAEIVCTKATAAKVIRNYFLSSTRNRLSRCDLKSYRRRLSLTRREFDKNNIEWNEVRPRPRCWPTPASWSSFPEHVHQRAPRHGARRELKILWWKQGSPGRD